MSEPRRVGQVLSRTGSPPTLDNDAVIDLVEHAQAGDETASETVARSFSYLVVRVAGEFEQGRDIASGRLAQLVNLGDAGLRTAISQFDASQGVRFSAYAAEQIRRAITGGASGAAGPGIDGGPSGGANDRYPRRPLPSSGAGSVALRTKTELPSP